MTDGRITQLLLRWRAGEEKIAPQLFEEVYTELRRVAMRQIRRLPPGQSLNPTGLVHEAYMRMVDQTRVQLEDRHHFLGVAARAMRQILVDHARKRMAQKRGGDMRHVSLQDADAVVEAKAAELVALDDALSQLHELNPRLSRTVELKFFGGLSIDEIAEVEDVSARTVKRDWKKSRAYLYRALSAVKGEKVGEQGP